MVFFVNIESLFDTDHRTHVEKSHKCCCCCSYLFLTHVCKVRVIRKYRKINVIETDYQNNFLSSEFSVLPFLGVGL